MAEQGGDNGLLEGRAMRSLNPILKLALEVGPLVVFFIANQRAGIYAATGLFMAAVLVSLAVSYVLTRHLPVMPMVSAVVVLVFGGLTLWLHDDLFIDETAEQIHPPAGFRLTLQPTRRPGQRQTLPASAAPDC